MREPLSYPVVRLFHQSDRFTPCLWSKFMTSSLVMISFHKGI